MYYAFQIRQWRGIQSRMRENSAQELVSRIENGNYGIMYPSEEDVKGAAIALLRLQDTYRLDPHELAEGRIYHDQLNRTLDCKFILSEYRTNLQLMTVLK